MRVTEKGDPGHPGEPGLPEVRGHALGVGVAETGAGGDLDEVHGSRILLCGLRSRIDVHPAGRAFLLPGVASVR